MCVVHNLREEEWFYECDHDQSSGTGFPRIESAMKIEGAS